MLRFLLFVASMLAFASVALAQTAAAKGDAAKGKELYVKYSCYACHGFDGHGGAGERLGPMKMLLPVFTAYIRSPRHMPAYRGKVLPGRRLPRVSAYCTDIPQPPHVVM